MLMANITFQGGRWKAWATGWGPNISAVSSGRTTWSARAVGRFGRRILSSSSTKMLVAALGCISGPWREHQRIYRPRHIWDYWTRQRGGPGNRRKARRNGNAALSRWQGKGRWKTVRNFGWFGYRRRL